MNLERKKIIAIVGPTAVGKTSYSLEVAKKYNGEIINGDSVQVYKGLDIGSAKIKPEEMDGIKHHLIDIVNPDQEYTVADFQRDCRLKIKEINDRGKVAIIVGGSGLYISSVLYDYKFEEFPEDTEKINSKTLEELQEIYREKYSNYTNVDYHNYPRLKSFIFKMTYSMDLQQNAKKSFYDEESFTIIGINMEREKLYQRINQRVDIMVKDGLIDEVKKFDSKFPSQSAIGYKEIHLYLNGEITLEEAIELVKRNSRRFAKKQLTWLRNKMEIEWIER